MFKIVHYAIDGICVLTIEGKLNHESYAIFDEYVEKLSYSQFIIDCRDLSYLSSVGLQSLIILAKSLHHSSGGIMLCEVNFWVKDVLDISGLNKIIPRCDNLQQALGYLK